MWMKEQMRQDSQARRHPPCLKARDGELRTHWYFVAHMRQVLMHHLPFPLLHLPADVLNAPFALLPELHVSLNGLLQVQDCGVLYHNHSCNTNGRTAMVGIHSHSLGHQERDPEALSRRFWTETQIGWRRLVVGPIPLDMALSVPPPPPAAMSASCLGESSHCKVQREKVSTYALFLHPSCTLGLSLLGHILVLFGN